MPVTKMVDSVPKAPKPQRIIRPPSAENHVSDLVGAHSGVMNQKLPTTFKPNFPTNMKPMYTAPVTTFHPKGNGQPAATMLYPKGTAQMVSGYPQQTPPQMMPPYYSRTTMQAVPPFYPKAGALPVSGAYNPKVTGQMTNYYPKSTAQMVSTFHPKATLQTAAANSIPTNYISTYHPKTSTYKVTQESGGMSSQPPLMTTAQNKFSSRFNSDTTYFVTPSPVTPTIRPNVKHLLATIGLEPDNNAMEINNGMSDMQQSASTKVSRTTPTVASTTTTTTTPEPTTKKPVLTAELKEILESFGLLTNEEPAGGSYQDEFHPVFPSALKDESLSVSDFKPLPKSVTASDIKEKIDSSYEIKPDDFSSFKRLPIKENEPAKDDELDSLLKTYGILEDDRTSKSDKKEVLDDEESESTVVTEKVKKIPEIAEMPEVNVEFLSPELRAVLGNIGVKNVKKHETPSTTPTITRRVDTATTSKVSYSSTAGVLPSSTMENDYQKLHLLLDTIKQLDSLTANLTDEELDKLNLKNFNLSQDILTESIGPDPTYGIEDEANAAKNEVKRQTNSSEPTRIQLDITGTTTTSASSTASDDSDLDDDTKSDDPKSDDSTTTETPERKGKQENLDKDESEKDDDKEEDTERETRSSSTTSTTEEPRNGSMSDLAGSFGGNDGLDPVSEEPLPPPRKNGFYFFSDWNSFLEVGEDPDKVEVRFDPKIGDQSPFVQVKIP